ncbi:MAG: hypothetical protein DWQ37_11330 [Planctomycetota bacterium]|nr:MAG: hypothetical protein DWQ37_11330 [Planctomycetota bacterium]
MPTILEEMLGKSISPQSFVDDYLFKLPFALSGGCNNLLDLGSWHVMGQLLRGRGTDVFVGNTRGERSPRVPTTCGEARELLAEGYTVGVRQAHNHHPGLRQLAASFREEFAAPVDVHLYATAAGASGLGWHYDAEDVFVLQTVGSKEWSLRKNTVNPWPVIENLPEDMHYEKEIMPLMRCLLSAGDWLYVPAGYWHLTRAGEESLSLSVGIASPTGVDVFDFVRSKVINSLRWRERLPAAANHADGDAMLADKYESQFRMLAEDLARILGRPDFAAEYLAWRKESGRQDGELSELPSTEESRRSP